MMLTNEQLQDAMNCKKISCGSCEMNDQSGPCAPRLAAECLASLERIKELEQQRVDDCTQIHILLESEKALKQRGERHDGAHKLDMAAFRERNAELLQKVQQLTADNDALTAWKHAVEHA